MKVPFIDYKAWYQIEKDYLDDIVLKCFNEGELLLRGGVTSFQNNLAKYVGTKYAVGTSNCTDALRLSLIASNITSGDEVITSAHTFAATVAAISQIGAIPCLADINKHDHLINLDSVKKLISKKTKAIMPISLNGRVSDNFELEKLCIENGLKLIEDAAQGLGAYLDGKMAGSFGESGSFSFYPAKTLGALGDAGAITTNSLEVYERLIALRNHNRRDDGNIEFWGYNNRIDNVQASVLDFRLTQIEKYIKRRREIAKLYFEELSDIEQLILPPNERNDMKNRDAFQNFEIFANNRDGLVENLRNNEIEIILPWGGYAIHHHNAFKGIKNNLHNTDKIFKSILMLPMHYTLQDNQIAYVIEKIIKYYK